MASFANKTSLLLARIVRYQGQIFETLREMSEAQAWRRLETKYSRERFAKEIVGLVQQKMDHGSIGSTASPDDVEASSGRMLA